MPQTQVPKWKQSSDSHKKNHRHLYKKVPAWNWQCILAVEKMALLLSA